MISSSLGARAKDERQRVAFDEAKQIATNTFFERDTRQCSQTPTVVILSFSGKHLHSQMPKNKTKKRMKSMKLVLSGDQTH